MTRFLFLSVTLLTFTGCILDEVSGDRASDLDKQSPVISSEAELQARTKRELAEIDAKRAVDVKRLENERALEQTRLELGKERLSVDKALELERIKHQTKVLEQESQLEMQRYVVLLIALVIIIIAIGVYFYLKHRREDKLRSYDDNLEKYFRSKENEMRYKLANRLLDAVATGDLTPEQQTQLIASMNTPSERDLGGVELIEDAKLIDGPQVDDETSDERDDNTTRT